MITQKELKEEIIYHPETGLFFWRVFKSGRKMDRAVGAVTGAGYLVTTFHYKQYSLHRLAFLYMLGSFPDGMVDHIDCNKLNNRWDNIRLATIFENAQNKPLGHTNNSGFKGVCWDRTNNRWKASINFNGKAKHLGMFKEKEDAANCVRSFREQVHKEFTRHN